ncbi:MAG: hypothetical protein JWM20_343 [Patescibacteria group bacterium]|nr:hypothetical protein [Patescibacteria group bacterium]
MFRNSAWIIGGKIAIFLLSFSFITALANLVPKNVVGSYNYIIAVLTIASIATLPGMNNALARAVAKGFEGSVKPMMQKKVLFGFLGSIISLGFGISYWFSGNHLMGLAFLLAAPLVPMTDTYSEMAYSFFQGRKDFKKTILLAVLCQACFSIPSLIIIFITHNLILITLSFFIFQTIGGLIVYGMIKPTNSLRDKKSEELGFHFTLQNIPRIIASNIDTVIVYAVAGAPAAAIYTFAYTPMNKIEQLIPIDILSLPDLAHQQNAPGIGYKIWTRILILILIMIPIIAIGWVLAPFAFHLLFPKFPESIFLFRILLITLITMPFVLPRTAFIAWGKNKELYINEIAAPCIRIVLMALLGIKFGALGVVIGIVIARFLEAGLVSILFSRLKQF